MDKAKRNPPRSCSARRFGSMKTALDEDQDFYNMFALLFGETLCGFLGILVRYLRCWATVGTESYSVLLVSFWKLFQ